MLFYGYLGVGLGGVGWGNNVHVNMHPHVMLRYSDLLLHLHTHVMLRYGYLGVGLGGVGWGNVWSSCQLAHTRHATLWLSSLALAHTRHATLWLSSLALAHTHTHTRHATLWWSALALAHTRHATLWLSWGGVGWGGVRQKHELMSKNEVVLEIFKTLLFTSTW